MEMYTSSLTTQIVAVSALLGTISKAAIYVHREYIRHKNEMLDDDEIDDLAKNDPETAKHRMGYLRKIVDEALQARGESNQTHVDDNSALVRIIFNLVILLGRGCDRTVLRTQVVSVIDRYNFPSRDLVVGLLETYFDNRESPGVLRDEYNKIMSGNPLEEKGDIT